MGHQVFPTTPSMTRRPLPRPVSADRITRVYTRTGDQGETGLVGGQRVPKDDLRIDAYGTVDELNAVVGLVRAELAPHHELTELDTELRAIQHRLFDLGSLLATLPDDVTDAMPRIRDDHVEHLEHLMDAANEDLEPLRNFVLPGGSRLNALLHLARTVCRRAERLVVRLHREGGCGDQEVRFLNRLSDAFFVSARQVAAALGHDEVHWRTGVE